MFVEPGMGSPVSRGASVKSYKQVEALVQRQLERLNELTARDTTRWSPDQTK